MTPLHDSLRKLLEKTIIQARDLAETGSLAALERLGVGQADSPGYLSEQERELRVQLRARARQLGDPLVNRVQGIERLVGQCAYELWHRMLFARFLAENGLLMHPDGIPVTLEECGELAAEEGIADAWVLATRYAARMLPQIFRPEDPVLQVRVATEHQKGLERLLTNLPVAVFTAVDSLGWVYQFWQANNKERINKAEVKIGAQELPAVTQLFTEAYMVSFLLDNALGAWWAARRLSADDLKTADSQKC